MSIVVCHYNISIVTVLCMITFHMFMSSLGFTLVAVTFASTGVVSTTVLLQEFELFTINIVYGFCYRHVFRYHNKDVFVKSVQFARMFEIAFYST